MNVRCHPDAWSLLMVLSVALLFGARASELAGQRPASYGSSQVLRPVSLEEAIRTAEEGNSALRIARTREDMARAKARAATGQLLPSLDLTTGYLRSVDPVVAFGTKLRQGRFGPDDLAIDALNNPGGVSDFEASARFLWSPVDLVRWAKREAEHRRAAAAAWGVDRAREATTFSTKVLYYEAAAAEARVAAAVASELAARTTHELFQRRQAEGLLTVADVLQAEAEFRAGEAETIAISMERDRARADLGVHLGWTVDEVPVPSDTLMPVEMPEPADFQPERRADLRALALLRDAAAEEERAASNQFLPVLDAFAGYSTHAGSLFGSDGTDWNVGIAVRWSLFSGLRRVANRQLVAAARSAADIRLEESRRQAGVEVLQAGREVSAARAGLTALLVGRRAADSGEALIRRRFEEGLVSPSDLLQAQARAASMRARALEATAAYNIAVARLHFVMGQVPLEVRR